jgi:hypothetical protein
MITNSSIYTKQSSRGVGTVFCMHDGFEAEAGTTFHCPQSKGREDVIVTLKKPHSFGWRHHDGWYFLEVKI